MASALLDVCMFSSAQKIAQSPKKWSQRRSSAWVLRASNLFDSEFTGAIFELEQHDMRGVRYDRPIWPEEVLSERVSHSPREKDEACSDKQTDNEPKGLFWYHHGARRWLRRARGVGSGSKANLCAHFAARQQQERICRGATRMEGKSSPSPTQRQGVPVTNRGDASAKSWEQNSLPPQIAGRRGSGSELPAPSTSQVTYLKRIRTKEARRKLKSQSLSELRAC
jgi:hypothetical protein